MREQPGEGLPACMTAGLQRRVNALLLASNTHSLEEVFLEQWFTAGEGHTAVGIIVERFVPTDRVHQLLYSIVFSNELSGIVVAMLYAGAAEPADIWIGKGAKLGIFTDGMLGTHGQTTTTSGTFRGIVHDFRLRALRFGILTPQAVQMATLEKHYGADPGPIFGGEAFDIKHKASKLLF